MATVTAATAASPKPDDEPAFNSAGERLLRSIIHIPKEIHEGDFVVELSAGFDALDKLVDEYVVTEQLREAFTKSFGIIRNAVQADKSRAAYLHGSFGSGKSHFMAVLAAALDGKPVARNKSELQDLLRANDEWLDGRKFLMVPFHLVGAESLDAAVLGGYAKYVRDHHPDAAPPLVHPDDLMLKDAAKLRASVGDEKFLDLLDLPQEDSDWGGTNAERIDRAFHAPPGDADRRDLVERLLKGPLSSYSAAVMGDKQSYLPLENGLAEISAHAKTLGYDAVILFLDELILWLMGKTATQDFVQSEAAKLVKLVESGDTRRPVPIVSFISRQRDITTLLHSTAVGAEEDNLRKSIDHNSGRFEVVNLEDRNLPAIARDRVLRPISGDARSILEAEFRKVESTRADVWDTLLDARGATSSDRDDFRTSYPFSPALLNTLVALSGALQRQRTGLKLLQEMLYRRRDDLTIGQLIPLGDLWDVLVDGRVEAFSDHLKREFDDAVSFHRRVRRHLLDLYGSADSKDYVATDRIVKTLLLAALAPEVPALSGLTGSRLAALNHGTFRSPIPGNEGNVVVNRLRQLAGHFGELRTDDNVRDPAFTLHLTELDADPVLERVAGQDTMGARRNWIQTRLWKFLGVKETNQFWGEREIVWRGTKRVVEFVYGNVRDPQELRTSLFEPSVEGRVRIVLDYPFDEGDHTPAQDVNRVRDLRDAGVDQPTVVWLPTHLSQARLSDLGRLIKVTYLLQRDRLEDQAGYLGSDDRGRLKNQLEASRANLASLLDAVLRQAYGLATPDPANLGTVLDRNVYSLLGGHEARLQFSVDFADSALYLADGLYDAVHPQHPNFDPGPFDRHRHPVTPAEIRTAWIWIQRAAEAGDPPRAEVERAHLATVKRLVHPLELGEVTDGPLVLGSKWRREIDRRAAARPRPTEDIEVADIYTWLDELGLTGLDKPLRNLIVGTYALLADRAWVRYGAVEEQPSLDQIGPGYALRAQDLPTPAQYETALRRGQGVFGVRDVPAFLSARNTARLARQVSEQVERHANAVNGLLYALDKHAADLGIDAASDRVASAKAAGRLIEKLRDAHGDTALVRALAAAVPGDVTDPALSAAIVGAQGVLGAIEALGDRAWAQLKTLRVLAARGDALADSAARALAELSDAARHSEFARKLAPALKQALDEAQALQTRAITEQRDEARPAAPPLPQDRPAAGTGHPVTDPGEVSLPLDPAPTSPARPEPARPEPAASGRTKTRRVQAARLATDLAAQLAAVREEITRLADAEPGLAFEITWTAVTEPRPDGDA